jgi:Zn-dependent peptidase ImmA (M78 family)/DNA-binding XRE family transcriptional regulator
MTAYITPDVLEWARNRSNLSFDELAQKIKVAPDRISDWESGEDLPTFPQAEKLAKALQVPLGYLFLPAPPEISTNIPDRRTLSGGRSKPLSNDFMDVLHDTIRKQDWYRDYLLRQGARPLDYLGKFDENSPVDDVAEDIRVTIKINDTTREKAYSWSNFLTLLINSTAEIGILVLRSGIVGNNTRRRLSVNEFRGFVLYDEYTPLIFLNSKDSTSAMIFTLVHELAHLWIGQSAISNPIYGQDTNNNRIETFCNQVAAEVLVPKENFVRSWQVGDDIDQNLSAAARSYRVSSLVILRRAYELGLISAEEYYEQYPVEIEKQIDAAARPASSGGSGYRNILARNHQDLTAALIRDVYEGGTSYREASRLLNVKPSTIDGIANYLWGER